MTPNEMTSLEFLQYLANQYKEGSSPVKVIAAGECLGDPYCPMDAHGIRHAPECGYVTGTPSSSRYSDDRK